MSFFKVWKIHIYSIIILLSVSACRCHKDPDQVPNYTLKPEEKEWIAYHENDVLTFQSNKGNIRAYRVSKVTDELNENSLKPSPYGSCTQYYYQDIYMTLERTDTIYSQSSYFSFTVRKKENRVFAFGQWDDFPGNFVLPVHELSNNLPIQDIRIKIIDQLVINNKAYTDVIEYSPEIPIPDQLTKLYYHKSYGVVKFQNDKGKFWELVN